MSRRGWSDVHSLIASIASVKQAYISPGVRTIFTILNPWSPRRCSYCAWVRSRPASFRIIAISIAIATGLSLGSSDAIFSTTSRLSPGICTTARAELEFHWRLYFAEKFRRWQYGNTDLERVCSSFLYQKHCLLKLLPSIRHWYYFKHWTFSVYYHCLSDNRAQFIFYSIWQSEILR